MSSDDWPDWLPADWFMQIRKIDQRKVKCYIDPEGHRCYSKPQVFEHLKKISNGTATKKTDNADGSTVDLSVEPSNTNEVPEKLPRGRPRRLSAGSSSKKYNEGEGSLGGDGSPSEPHGDSKWLPDGWTVDVKIRQGGSSSGMKYKIYTDPISGQKFFSKPQVLSHLAKINGSATVQREVSNLVEKYSTKKSEATEVKDNKTEKKTESARLASDYDVISRTPAEGLPQGWIKEIRIRKRGIAKKKDPYYLDPSSEYVFFSKKDAQRYLDSGDIRRCVMRPLKRDLNEDVSHFFTLTPTPTPTGGELASPPTAPSKETELAPPNGTETSEALPNGSENGTENKTPVRSITGGLFSTPDTSRSARREARSISGGSFPKPSAALKEEASDWLPEGWTVEVNYKNSGVKYKIYHETATGRKFYSKPQVLNYLANGPTSNSNSRKRKEKKSSVALDSSPDSEPASAGRPKRSKKKKNDSTSSDFKEEITTTPAEGLPPGWTKEIRTKIYGTHKRSDPFYTDPVSGYIFRSKVDAFRYLETGDVNLCAIRPKVKDKDGNEVPVYTHDVQKPVKSATDKQPIEGKEGEKSTEKQQNDGDSTPARGRASSRIAKRTEPPTALPARSSRRHKGNTPENNNAANPAPAENNNNNGSAAVQENQGSGINLEKQADDDGRLSYDIPEDENWTDQCLDFAVKTLTNEILFNGQPTTTAGFQEENARVETSVNETTPTKVN